jgi:formylmethanofuran dehydrogenase subunit E
MNELETVLYRKKASLLEVCRELGIPIEEADIPNLETCSNCSIWFRSTDLIQDLDGNPICKVCNRFYGL